MTSKGYAGFGYNIADAGRINILHSRAGALHTVREHLTDLHRWSEEEHHIGSRFASIFADMHGTLSQARGRRAAALELRKALAATLTSAIIPDSIQSDLRDRLVATYAAAGNDRVVEPFAVIFRHAAVQAASWYRQGWPDGLRFAIETLGPRPFPDAPFWVNAETDLHLDDPRQAPTVHLRVRPERLNVETYAAVFAVLVHELVCHVPAPRLKSSPSSPFSEGFVDWAALQLFERWLYELDPLLRDAARKFGREIWGLGMSKGKGNPGWAARSGGHEAAEHVADLFRENGKEATAVDQTIILARELTVLDASATLKDILVRRLKIEIDEEARELLLCWSAHECTADDLLQLC